MPFRSHSLPRDRVQSLEKLNTVCPKNRTTKEGKRISRRRSFQFKKKDSRDSLDSLVTTSNSTDDDKEVLDCQYVGTTMTTGCKMTSLPQSLSDNYSSGDSKKISMKTDLVIFHQMYHFEPSTCEKRTGLSNSDHYQRWITLADDPTISESIECVFSHQLESGDTHLDLSSEMNNNDTPSLAPTMNTDNSSKLSSTSSFLSWIFRSSYNSKSLKESDSTDRKELRSSRVVYVSSCPSELHMNHSNSESFASLSNDDLSLKNPKTVSNPPLAPLSPPDRCQTCSKNNITNLPPVHSWPQKPLLLRPTPGSRTVIKGIRFADSTEYLCNFHSGSTGSAETSEKTWYDILNAQRDRKNDIKKTSSHNCTLCSCCTSIPINNGNEVDGKVLVTDFETSLFEGTLLIRIRGSKGSTNYEYDDSTGYFSSLNRQYQTVIQGRFKKEGIPMTECITGQVFTKPLVLPSQYICRGFLKVMKFFSPLLQAKLDGPIPYILTFLGSTPQTICVDDYNPDSYPHGFQAGRNIGECQSEPIENNRTIIQLPGSKKHSTSIGRAKARKNAFEKLCVLGDKSLVFRTDKIYTFEFLQHLIDFQNLEFNLGSVFGKVNLANMLNNQQLKIMAAHQRPSKSEGKVDDDSLEILWSFDLWHLKTAQGIDEKS